MGRIAIDDATVEKLANAGECSELCDSSGKVVGYYTPPVEMRLEPQISEEKIQRRMGEGKVCTFEEVMAHLTSL